MIYFYEKGCYGCTQVFSLIYFTMTDKKKKKTSMRNALHKFYCQQIYNNDNNTFFSSLNWFIAT